MRILVVGGGGREHALVWKIAQSPLAEKVFCAPGNPGTARLAENVAIAADDVDGLVRWASENGIGLVVVGPEAPLVLGLADRLTAARIQVFGPSAAAAQLEGSKAFAKEVMRAASIPTADHGAFDALGPALSRARAADGRVVIKADGLAAGKGVVVCSNLPEAEEALRAILVDRIHGAAGARVVVEERLEGPEVSVIALVDGERVLVLPPAQDHKRIFDGDRGPNTGGMGAFTPTPTVNEAFLAEVRDRVLVPTVREMARRETPFRGALYAGIMITKDGPKVLEFNARFGDPETQPILMRLTGDLVPALLGAARGDLSSVRIDVDPRAAVGVVMAAEGYPGRVTTGDAIEGTEGPFSPGVQVFQAGTRRGADGLLVTSGGRVLTVCALGADRADAAARAYETLARVKFRGAQYRRDIGRTGPGETR
jgi:phosphoribosylamine--glycine ligase